jgi:hypothetical protein
MEKSQGMLAYRYCSWCLPEVERPVNELAPFPIIDGVHPAFTLQLELGGGETDISSVHMW